MLIAYLLWPLAKKFQNWIVDQSTVHNFTVSRKLKLKMVSVYMAVKFWSFITSFLLGMILVSEQKFKETHSVQWFFAGSRLAFSQRFANKTV